MMMLLAGVSLLLIVSVVFSLVRNDYWVFRILEYPRLQKLFLMLGVFGLWLIYWPAQHTFYQILVACLAVCIILLETNSDWAYGVKDLAAQYPHQLTAPLENTYGLLFYSRFELKNASV